MTKLVYVVRKDSGITRMFQQRKGYQITNEVMLADVIVWGGGADVNPEIYGQKPIEETHSSPDTDALYQKVWEQSFAIADPKIARVGICLGGQWLNCKNKGSMWQHVNNHGRSHDIIDLTTGEKIMVTSTHHQMMRPHESGEVLAVAHEATLYKDQHKTVNEAQEYDTEVVYYAETNSLCFQPHPEYSSKHTEEYFFKLLEKI